MLLLYYVEVLISKKENQVVHYNSINYNYFLNILFLHCVSHRLTDVQKYS